MPPLGGFPSEYCHAIWYRKTRMVWLPDGQKIWKICLFVLTQCTNVTACIALRGKNSDKETEKYLTVNETQ